MPETFEKTRAPRNRTIIVSAIERAKYKQNLVRLCGFADLDSIKNRTINQSLFEILDYLPEAFVDLLFVDPPYNLTKSFNEHTFKERSDSQYREWIETWLPKLSRTLKPTGSLYVCGDWRSSAAIYSIARQHFVVRNRITWEREKGRGASANWKNCSEDIWFCTRSDKYTFNTDAVRMKRRVIAPYRSAEGLPKDWHETAEGDFRLTSPSNLWTDLTIPFWSMPENTDHPTQKPEKLLAKIILASSKEGDLVFDPFLGSGTCSVVAKKLRRDYVGIEIEEPYCILAEKRLELARKESQIQGFDDGVFWERNSGPERRKNSARDSSNASLPLLENLEFVE